MSQQLHAALDVQRGCDARQRQAQFHQRDRHGRLHADQHGSRIENARHAGNVGDHAADEGVDHFQRRNVDEHAFGALLLDRAGQIILQLQRQLIVHVDLDGDEQELAHPQYRYAVHALLLA